MHPTLITHYGHRLKRKKSRIYRKSLRCVLVSRNGIVTTMSTITHYTSEIKQQAKVFKNNFNRINDYERN